MTQQQHVPVADVAAQPQQQILKLAKRQAWLEAQLQEPPAAIAMGPLGGVALELAAAVSTNLDGCKPPRQLPTGVPVAQSAKGKEVTEEVHATCAGCIATQRKLAEAQRKVELNALDALGRVCFLIGQCTKVKRHNSHKIRYSHIVGDAISRFGGTKWECWRSTTLLKVTYEDEFTKKKQQGDDYGGLADHFLSEIFDKLPATPGFTTPEGGFTLPYETNLDSNGPALKALGRLLCNFLFRKFIDQDEMLESRRRLAFCSQFSPFLFSFICHEEHTKFATVDAALGALEDFNPALAKTWRQYTTMGSATLVKKELTTNMCTKEEGPDDPATAENVHATVTNWCKYMLVGKRCRALELVRDAFYDIGPTSCQLQASLNDVGGYQLEGLLCAKMATPQVVLHGVRQGGGWHSDNQAAFEDLRKIIGDLDQSDLKGLIQFVTGGSTLAADGDGSTVDAGELGRMPSASTCAKVPTWPIDATREKLVCAIHDAQRNGFQTQWIVVQHETPWEKK